MKEVESREQERIATYHKSIIANQRDSSWEMRGERKNALQPDERERQNEKALEMMVWRSDEFERREQERETVQKQEGESTWHESWHQQSGEAIQGVEKYEERERSHPAEWQIQQAELLLEVAEARANSLQWRLSMTEGREQERLELQQLEREMQQSSERAQKAEGSNGREYLAEGNRRN